MRRDLGAFFFKYRDVLPVPLALAMLWRSRPRLVNWLFGLPLIAIGQLLRIWSLRHIGPTTRTRDICADVLVTSGPYAYTRNPLYLANLLKVLGILTVAGDFSVAVATLFFYGLEFSAIIPYEEQFLSEKFPEAFAQYAEAVPVFFPDGRQLAGERSPAGWGLGEAIKSERRTFTSTGLILAVLGLCGVLRALLSADGTTLFSGKSTNGGVQS
ncbi:MAG: isoprenylcysteine carboxylmethyltransferase family protein [Candidatus Ozemobacteraceae bacterium]